MTNAQYMRRLKDSWPQKRKSRAASINDLIHECVAAGYDEAFTVRYVQAQVSTSRISAKRLREIYQDERRKVCWLTISVPGELLFDVVIYETATRKIDALIGKNMCLWDGTGSGRNTADLRKQTGQERINDKFDVAIVIAGKYKQVLDEGRSGAKFEPEILDEKDAG